MEKSNTIEKLFYYIVTSTYLILPVLYLILQPKKKYSLIIAVYGIVAFTLLFCLENAFPKNLIPLFVCIYTSLEYLFFSSFLYLIIKSKSAKKVILVLSCLFIVFEIIFFLTGEIGRLDSIPIGIETILIFLYVFIVLYEQFKNIETHSMFSTYYFWLALGLLIYLGGSFFFNIMINYISSKEMSKYLYITYIPETLKNIFFAIAMFLNVKNSGGDKFSKAKSVPYLDMI